MRWVLLVGLTEKGGPGETLISWHMLALFFPRGLVLPSRAPAGAGARLNPKSPNESPNEPGVQDGPMVRASRCKSHVGGTETSWIAAW